MCDAAAGIRNLTFHPGRWVGGCWRFLASAAASSSCAKLKHGGFGGITTKTVEGKGCTHAASPHSDSRESGDAFGWPLDAIGSSRLFGGGSAGCLVLALAS